MLRAFEHLLNDEAYFKLTFAHSLEELVEAAEGQDQDAVIIDASCWGPDSLRRWLCEIPGSAPVVMVSDSLSELEAIRIMDLGFSDCVTNMSRLNVRVRRTIREHQLRRQVEQRSRQMSALMQLGLEALKGGGLETLCHHAVGVVAASLHLLHVQIYCRGKDRDPLLVASSSSDLVDESGVDVLTKSMISQLESAGRRQDWPEGVITQYTVSQCCAAIVIGGAAGAPYGYLLGYDSHQREFSHEDALFLRNVGNILTNAVIASRAENDLRASQEQFRVLSEKSPVAKWCLEYDGRHSYANSALCRLIGVDSPDALVGKSLFDYLTLPSGKLLKDKFAAFFEGEQLFLAVNRLKGPPAYVLAAGSTYDSSQHGRRMLMATFVDYTEQRKLEEQLHQTQKLESVGRLAGGIAHDFNNLLTVIIGYGNLLLPGPDAPDEDREAVDIILDAANRAADLTRQLLVFSRRQVTRPKVTNLNAVLRDIRKMLERLIGEDIHLDFKTDDVMNICIDPSLLEQVIMNLAVNARDAMPKGGSLVFETSNAFLDEDYVQGFVDLKPGDFVRLAVSDTGKGMTSSVKERIFEPFFTTKSHKGTGLGLSTVFGIVKQCNGHIHVYSEPGQGTSFKIYFPAVDAPISASRKILSAVNSDDLVGTETVLVVEDDQTVRFFISRVLRAKGYRVLEASEPQEAEKICREFSGKIDLLLTDVVMPNCSGPEFAASMRQQRPDVKTLFMSGYTDQSFAHHKELEKTHTIMEKPFTSQFMLERIRAELDS